MVIIHNVAENSSESWCANVCESVLFVLFKLLMTFAGPSNGLTGD